ncbi:MAG: hypothetical protein Q8P38_10700, partial [Candidatus Nanopelagicales bacterium]|nr:hypothetical protein [Candidatus Nanopelagicales bacterium]
NAYNAVTSWFSGDDGQGQRTARGNRSPVSGVSGRVKLGVVKPVVPEGQGFSRCAGVSYCVDLEPAEANAVWEGTVNVVAEVVGVNDAKRCASGEGIGYCALAATIVIPGLGKVVGKGIQLLGKLAGKGIDAVRTWRAPRFVGNAAGDLLDTARVTVPSGKPGYLLKDPAKAGIFADRLGFDEPGMDAALRSHLTSNFGSASSSVPMLNGTGQQIGTKFLVRGPMTGPSGRTFDITASWGVDYDGAVRFITAFPTN